MFDWLGNCTSGVSLECKWHEHILFILKTLEIYLLWYFLQFLLIHFFQSYNLLCFLLRRHIDWLVDKHISIYCQKIFIGYPTYVALFFFCSSFVLTFVTFLCSSFDISLAKLLSKVFSFNYWYQIFLM